MKRIGFILFILLCLSVGCASVGPNYHRKDPVVPNRFGSLEQDITTGEPVGSELLTSWWRTLEDPVLNSLMDRAVRGNLDLRVAQARVLQARALSRVSSSLYLPEGGPNARYERSRSPASSLPTTRPPWIHDRQSDLFLVGFDSSWEIDVFGGVRRGVEAAEADLAASEDTLRDTLVTLQGEVARNYVEYRGQQLRLDIAKRAVQIRRDNAEISEARARAGLVSELDWSRARAELATAESIIPSLENSLSAALHRLGILLGQEPLSLASELKASAELPRIPENLPVGLPSDLLRRRPDIRRTEREVAAATARIGVSTAQLFPRFSLTGSLGFQSPYFDAVVLDSGNFWRFGPTMNWPILNFKRILSNIAFTQAVREETLARYEQSVLFSLEEVENSLVNLSREKRRIEALAGAVRSNEEAVELARQLYLAGAQSYLSVIDSETALYRAQDDLAQGRQSHALAFVSLYKSLGGGWLDMYGTDDQETN
ncbi:MAG: efflux transporter outer membrane subunit [Deltaproteobacteria bacterium]